MGAGNNFTEIILDNSPTTLITGSNGAGKSTMLDALTFVLYNKPFRKINKPLLVNSINEKQCLVEIEFDVKGRHYLIRRGIKPTVFQIFEHTSYDNIDSDDNLVDQDAKSGDYQGYLERDVLKMNYQAFTQVVILGKATYVPFMRLDAAKRRAVIEDLLGLNIFGKMNELVKSKMKTLKSNLSEYDTSILIAENSIESKQQYIDKMRDNRDDQINEVLESIKSIDARCREIETEVGKENKILLDLVNSIDDQEDVRAKINKLEKLKTQLQTKRKGHEDIIKFFDTHDVCPTCTLQITDDHREPIVNERRDKVDKLNDGEDKIDDDLDVIYDRLDAIDAVRDQIKQIDRTIQGYSSEKKSLSKQSRDNESRLNKLKLVNTDNDQDEVDKLRAECDELKAKRNELQEQNAYYMTIGSMLKDDGIKTVIINKYLPLFNKFINDYLTKMGFLVKFTLDEQFNEKILSRYRDKFSYNSFSEGQRLRIDLAILFTWREIAKTKNSLNTNLLIMDEVFDSSLDQDGVDAFMSIIPSLGDANIFVISHTPDKLYDKFRSHLTFTTHNQFSIIAESS